ncbi:Uncharacterized protein TCAP_03571, partial [Tolypocladium capitatum]
AGERTRRRRRRSCFGRVLISCHPPPGLRCFLSSSFLPQPNKPISPARLLTRPDFGRPFFQPRSSSLAPSALCLPSVLHEPPTVSKMRFSSVALLAGSALAGDVSTAYTTQLVTVTACPASVTNCPARSKTSSVVTSVVPLTTSTVYSTKVHTITSCAATVTNCPAHSTVVSTETIAISTTVCPVAATKSYSNSTVAAATPTKAPVTSVALPTSANYSAPAAPAPVCPGSTVKAITKSYTTVLTTVEYKTVAVPCPTAPAPAGTAAPPAVVAPPAAAGNSSTTPSPITAGAASLAGSALFAAAAGVVAFVFA